MPLRFLKNFFQHPREMGALLATGRAYSQLACKQVDWPKVAAIAELGAGDGAVTKYIISNLRSQQKLLVFEYNEDLFAVLKQRFGNLPNVILINDSAEKLAEYAEQNSIKQFDAIFSEVPLVSLPKKVGENIVQAVLKTLKPSGLYLQIQYSIFSLGKLKKLFKAVSLKFTPFNFPPAFLYICSL
ncbi:MAG: methyltransferase domain-containing protein [Candidatus Abawacabacteria bacterium]|nr:methyltransferase domain-containing protein [Candidatus Abawacabacteria bacterium]